MASALAFSTSELLDDEDGTFIGLFQSGGIGGGQPQSGEYAGTKALMLAVLEDAIRCFLGSQRLPREEAEVWISMRRQNWPFSFNAVCEVLGLEPSAVRRAMVRMRERSVGRRAIARSRPNSGRRTRVMGSRSQAGRRRSRSGEPLQLEGGAGARGPAANEKAETVPVRSDAPPARAIR